MIVSPVRGGGCSKIGHARRPRLGCIGTGGVVLSLAKSNVATIAGIASLSMVENICVAQAAPDAIWAEAPEGLFELDLDGLVVTGAGPAGLEWATIALQKGIPVFCESPVGASLHEIRRLVDTAGEQDVLLGMDFPCRWLTGCYNIKKRIDSGSLGRLFAAELAFHSSGRPIPPIWGGLAGGGAVDSGAYLLDVAMWSMGYPEVAGVIPHKANTAHCTRRAEDFASLRLMLTTGASVQVSCSWRLPAGCGPIISGTFCGSKGVASFQNVESSYTRFQSWTTSQGRRVPLPCPRANRMQPTTNWLRRLASDPGYDPEVESILSLATILQPLVASY